MGQLHIFKWQAEKKLWLKQTVMMPFINIQNLNVNGSND